MVASLNILSHYILQLTLQQEPAQIASEYYTKHEMAQFRKPKKKKKIRRLKADDLLGFSAEEKHEVHGHRCVTMRCLCICTTYIVHVLDIPNCCIQMYVCAYTCTYLSRSTVIQHIYQCSIKVRGECLVINIFEIFSCIYVEAAETEWTF